MPLSEDRYSFFQPLYDMNDHAKETQLVASVEVFLPVMTNRINWTNTMVSNPPSQPFDYPKFTYLEMMKSFVSATVFGNAEVSIQPSLNSPVNKAVAFNIATRTAGKDWTYLGDTMTGWARLDNVRDLLIKVINQKVEGDYIETGVWRGGSSVFARAVIRSFGEAKRRTSYVCDSFQGLPPGERGLDKGDKKWDNTPYLEVHSDIVANNFIKYGLLDSNVVFAKGFFNDTMPHLAGHIDKLSIMRLDGDMYESTVDVLYHLYDKLSVGGYVIMDDWQGFPSKIACEDFFDTHKISPEIVSIDSLSAYWQKTEEVDIQYWRYEQSKFKK